MTKELLKQRFTKSLKTYQQNAIVQKQMAEKLTQNVLGSNFDDILELGCGTGFVTEILNEHCRFNNYDAIDIVNGCKSFIEKISNNINFINTDIEDFSTQKKYNLIISNASLQWLEDFEQFIKKIKSNLKEDGIFLFTLFGENNFKELKAITGKTLEYYSTDTLTNILNNYSIKTISEETITLTFKTPKDVLYHIKNTGVNAIAQEHWTKSDLIRFEQDYYKLCDKNITLTYNPIYIEVKQK